MAAQDERLVPSSQAKLDELFLHWLSLPDAQQYVLTLLASAKQGRSLVNVVDSGSGSPSAEDRGGLSPKNRAGIASPPPRSPTGRSPNAKHSPEGSAKDNAPNMWVEGGHQGAAAGTLPSKDNECKHGEDTVMADRQAPAVRKPTPVAAHIPRFFTPRQPSKDAIDSAQAEMAEIESLFKAHPGGLTKEEFKPFAVTVCGYPSFFAQGLFEKLVPDGQSLVTRQKCVQWWETNMRHKKPEVRLFHFLREGNQQHVTRADWKKRLAVLLDTHPGLDFLKATPEFQDRYLECVVERIYYVNNRACNDRLTQHDISLSNLVRVLKYENHQSVFFIIYISIYTHAQRCMSAYKFL